jgi:hypothetical protein
VQAESSLHDDSAYFAKRSASIGITKGIGDDELNVYNLCTNVSKYVMKSSIL